MTAAEAPVARARSGNFILVLYFCGLYSVVCLCFELVLVVLLLLLLIQE